MAPAFRVVQGGIGTGNDDSSILALAGLKNLAKAANARLSPCPCNLYELWTEYTVGWFGREEARISVFRQQTWKIKRQVFSTQRRLENGEALSGRRDYV